VASLWHPPKWQPGTKNLSQSKQNHNNMNKNNQIDQPAKGMPALHPSNLTAYTGIVPFNVLCIV